MDVTAHTTPASRQELRNYLRNRRLVTSIYQTITTQTLNDLEEALRLLRGVQHAPGVWTDEIEAYLSPRVGQVFPDPSAMLPGLFEQR